MEIDWIDYGLKFLMGFLGLLIYALVKVREYLGPQFSKEKFINENKQYWYWTLAIFLVLYISILIDPEVAKAIKSITGMDLEDSKNGWLFFVYGLSALANSTVVKNPIGKKPEEKGGPPAP